MSQDKLFTVAGTATNPNGTTKARFANDLVARIKILNKAGCTDINLMELPTAMTNLADVDTINDPYYNPVQFYAAYQAKYFEQSFGEAEIFKQQYDKQVMSVQTSVYTRRMLNPYSTPY